MSERMKWAMRGLQYTEWGNRRSLEALQSCNQGASAAHSKAISIIGHAVLSQMCWFDRVVQRPMRRHFWVEIPISGIEALIQESTKEWMTFFEEQGNAVFERQIEYVNSRGESFVSSIEEIITHVINHSTYHRGQVNLLIRQCGGEPPMTDFIVYARGR